MRSPKSSSLIACQPVRTRPDHLGAARLRQNSTSAPLSARKGAGNQRAKVEIQHRRHALQQILGALQHRFARVLGLAMTCVRQHQSRQQLGRLQRNGLCHHAAERAPDQHGIALALDAQQLDHIIGEIVEGEALARRIAIAVAAQIHRDAAAAILDAIDQRVPERAARADRMKEHHETAGAAHVISEREPVREPKMHTPPPRSQLLPVSVSCIQRAVPIISASRSRKPRS